MDRDYLQSIRKEAESKAVEVKNPYWKRAYYNLADAADRVDAMEARTEERPSPKS